MTIINDVTSAPPKARAAKLGEELPIFCERCGYNLNGLRQTRCEHCDILQFHCPECGHHQSINTLRPAAQRIISRLRAVWLCGVVLFKLNFFGWLLLAWFAMGSEWSYSRNYIFPAVNPPGSAGRPSLQVAPRPVDYGEIIGFTLLALSFAMVGRMLLLRWRRAERVGAVLAVLAVGAILLGAQMIYLEHREMVSSNQFISQTPIEPPWTSQFLGVMAWTAGVIIIGAILVWPIWTLFVRAFLPKNVSHLLLEWQRSQSDRSPQIDRPISALSRT